MVICRWLKIRTIPVGTGIKKFNITVSGQISVKENPVYGQIPVLQDGWII
jgi:hypothetical protein